MRGEKMLNKIMKKYLDWNLIFLRFGVGLIFLVHGLGKLLNVGPAALGLAKTSGFFATLGIPAAAVMAVVVALVETLGGAFLIVGLFTRFAALGLSINMLVAFLLVHLPKGFSIQKGGYEFVMLLFFGAVTLFFAGAGKKLVLEKKLFGKEF